MSWGWKIALFYGSFVAFMLFMVFMAVRQDFDLVSEDYYEQEIAYQDRIDQMNNAAADGQEVTITKSDAGYELAFTGKAENVKVQFFRPSDESKDVVLEEASVEEPFVVAADRFSMGKYLVKVEWRSNGKTYFQEQNLFVN